MGAPIPSTGNLIDVYRIDPDGSGFDFLVTPEAPIGVSIRPEENGCGTGGFSIPMDDAAYGQIDINDVVAVRGDGRELSFVVEMIREHTLDAGEGSRTLATYEGRGVGVFTEWFMVAPALGERAKPIEDDSVFDWRSRRYDPALDAWAAATEIMSVATAEGGAWPHQPMADRFDLTTGAQMILSSSGDDEYAPAGWYLFYRDIDIATPGRWAQESLHDDKGFFWVDTIQQLEVPAEDGFVTASFKRLELSSEVHRFCWAVYNFEDPENPGFGLGPAALAYNLYKADLQDQPLPDGESYISDSNTKVLYVGDDPWPGMTVGDLFGQIVTEGQALGVVPWLDLSFDEDDDSASAAWDRETGITTKTGTTSGLQFLSELVASGRIEQWRVRNDGVTFELVAPGYSDPSGITLEPAPVDDPRTGQLVQLDRVIT